MWSCGITAQSGSRKQVQKVEGSYNGHVQLMIFAHSLELILILSSCLNGDMAIFGLTN